jgi:LPS O-antigen subunit length determinant protein (WzzB/FepE family)
MKVVSLQVQLSHLQSKNANLSSAFEIKVAERKEAFINQFSKEDVDFQFYLDETQNQERKLRQQIQDAKYLLLKQRESFEKQKSRNAIDLITKYKTIFHLENPQLLMAYIPETKGVNTI